MYVLLGMVISVAHGAPITPPASESMILSSQIDLLIDPGDKLDVRDLARPDIAARFAPLSALRQLAADPPYSIWIRFTLQGVEHAGKGYFLEYLNPIADRVELFLPSLSDGYGLKVSGDTLARQGRDLDHRHPIFHLPAERTEQTYFLRLSGASIKLIRLTLWPVDRFYAYQTGNYFLLGLYFGVMGLLAVANLALGLIAKERIFFSYGLYLTVYALMQASVNGLSFQFLWPNAVFWADRAPGVLVGLSVAFGIGFIRVLLETKRLFPRYDKALLALAFIGLSGSVLNLSLGARIGGPVVIGGGLTLAILALPAGWMSLRLGNQSARYFLFAWSIFLCGVFVTGLAYLGLLPANQYSINAMQIGSSFESILLLLAVAERIHRLRQDRENAERRARSDGLTGLLNHKAFVDAMELRLKESAVNRIPASLLMIDLDYFKEVNDHFGHLAGDRVLEDVAKLLRENTRSQDLVGRYGGEEFAVFLWDISAEEALEIAKRTRQQLANQGFPYLEQKEVSASFGVVHLAFAQEMTAEEAIRRADIALYQAKKRGRNRVEVWLPSAAMADFATARRSD